MSTKLTDAQRAALSAAAIREDKCVPLPPSLRGATLKKTREKLIESELVREVKAKPSSPIWRRDDATGATYSLKLTSAGVKALRAGDTSADVLPREAGVVDSGRNAQPLGLADIPAPAPSLRSEVDADPPSTTTKSFVGAPRPGSKIAEVLTLLGRDDGATIPDLIAATGWLPHTTRAALTGLRKRGYSILSERSEGKHGLVYRIEAKRVGTEPAPQLAATEAP